MELRGDKTVFAGQVETFAITVATGILLALIFDFYRVMRGVFRPKLVITSLVDLIYWLIATIIVFLVLLIYNGGEVRVYVFMGLLCGVMGYYRLCSRFAIRVLIHLIRFFIMIVRWLKVAVITILVKPIAYCIRLLSLPGIYIGRKIIGWYKSSVRPDDEAPPPQ